jgi:hypothetical protein
MPINVFPEKKDLTYVIQLIFYIEAEGEKKKNKSCSVFWAYKRNRYYFHNLNNLNIIWFVLLSAKYYRREC